MIPRAPGDGRALVVSRLEPHTSVVVDEEDDFDITPAIRHYLGAFERGLSAEGDDAGPAVDDRESSFKSLKRDQRLRLRSRNRRLTPRETEVLKLRCAGLTYEVIAERLTISIKTVDQHCRSIATKVGTGNPYLTAIWAVREGLVDP